MEERSSEHLIENMDRERFILKFKAATGFIVVLEYPGPKKMTADRKKIEDAGLTCERIPQWNAKFDTADLYMDLRSPVCATQFELDDWI